MIDALIRFSLNQRLLVIMLSLLLITFGLWSLQSLPIDAVPDITTVQVQINTPVKALAPAEIEKLVTFPIETAMRGLPGEEEIRSITNYGLSQVTVVFEDGTDIYFARQLILERLQEARENLPAGIGEPSMGPVSTGLGEIYFYTVEGGDRSPTELRTIEDWIIKPQLLNVPGVAEVNSIGGFTRQYHVLADPVKLLSYGLTFRDVFEALAANNANAGGATINHNGEQYVIRGVGLARTIGDLESIVLATRDGAPVYIRDVATVREGGELRTGAGTENGREVVLSTAMMRLGANSRTVSTAVDEKLREIEKQLPQGVTIETAYNRTDLVDQTIETVKTNLFEGGVLVVVVLLLLLGNVRAAFIVALAIPLSMLFAVTGMVRLGISGNLLSLGAIDFGLIVDGAVVMVENVVRRLAGHQQKFGRVLTRDERRDVLAAAALEVGRPVCFAVAIIMVVYLPILTLQGIEGKMFRPMAATVLLALGGSLLLALTLIPTLCSLLLRGRMAEKENVLMGAMKAIYAPALNLALRWRWLTVGLAIAAIAAAIWVFRGLGAVFVPQLDEGSLAMEIQRLPSISLDQAIAMQEQVEKELLKFPEVTKVFARIGTAEVATDAQGPNRADVWVMLKPQEHWRTAHTREGLVAAYQEQLEKLPGQSYGFSQPIELRFNELISGVKADLAVKVFGEDMGTLLRLGNRINRIVSSIPGAEDVATEQVSGLPSLDMEIDRQVIARYGVNVADVLDLIETAIGGRVAGQIFEGEKRFDLVVRLPGEIREEIDALGQLTVKTPAGAFIPLSELAHIELVEGLNQISRENGARRLAVQANIRGRDIDRFVAELRRRLDHELELPPGYHLEFGGQFKNLQDARRRLAVIVPLALALIFFLLFSAFNSLRQSLLIFTGVPLAIVGGIFALALRGMPFSISASIGFIALSGVAVLNGVVMVSYFNRLREEGRDIPEAVYEGALTRLRPVLMTALVASLGFVPMALATGPGADVQRPLATVVIGGLISATALTLFVLPVLYRWCEREKPRSRSSVESAATEQT
jgi:cobalt-zinc-cadmium resistance protein CzcA